MTRMNGIGAGTNDTIEGVLTGTLMSMVLAIAGFLSLVSFAAI